MNGDSTAEGEMTNRSPDLRQCGGDGCDASSECGSIAKRQPVGYLLIGHGTRSKQGTDEFFELHRLVAQRLTGTVVEAGFLELQSPTIREAWDRLLDCGAQFVRAVPLLLFAAGHALEDIPAELRRCCLASAAVGRRVCFSQTPAFGCNQQIIELSRRRTLAAMPDQRDYSRTALVMVGRGSNDRAAVEQMHRFARLQAATIHPTIQQHVGFLAMAQPTLAQVLAEVSTLPEIDDVIVQPHLLFDGALNRHVASLVANVAQSTPHLRWHLADRLGPDPMLADALIDLCRLPIQS